MEKYTFVPGSEQLISGALHYFRVHPDLWDDRLDKAVALGLNCIESYIPWNLHEPHPGEFVFDGICDLEKFITKVAEHGLKMILRPGPYICAEWDNGGFPGWLNALPGVVLRCMNQPYLEAVEKYFTVLFTKILPHLSTNGGPVIMLQVENEYGSFGNDHAYIAYLRDMYIRLGVDVPLFTSDGPYGNCPIGGGLEGLWLTANFGTESEKAFDAVRKLRPDEPDCCMEFWDGWFDHWGEKHTIRENAVGENSFENVYEAMIKRGASVNMYMFHGGTNFGFTAGANGNNFHDYAPCVTSYDYDCPLSECGDPTEKFTAAQNILKKYTANPRIAPVAETFKICPAPAELTASCSLLENVEHFSVRHGQAVKPPTLEELGENHGFVLYRRMLELPEVETHSLRFFGVNDYVQTWFNGQYMGHLYRCNNGETLELPYVGSRAELLILTENLGRINYGPFVGKDFKGISGSVCLGFQQQFNWEYDLIPLSDVQNIPFGELRSLDRPAVFYRGTFTVDECGEAFLKRPGKKGCVWINGFNVGRYWEIGPTETLYIPSPVLKKGLNEIIIFEQEELYSSQAEFSPTHELGELAKTAEA